MLRRWSLIAARDGELIEEVSAALDEVGAQAWALQRLIRRFDLDDEIDDFDVAKAETDGVMLRPVTDHIKFLTKHSPAGS